jgi:hypothetical protein
LRHVGDRLGTIVLDAAPRRRARGEGERWPRAGDGTLGSRPQLFGPIEALLLVISWTAVGTVVSHGSPSETHAADKRSGGSRLGVGWGRLIIVNGALVNGIGVGGDAASAHGVGNRVAGRGSRETKSCDGETTSIVGGRVGLIDREGWAAGVGVAPEEVGKGRLCNGATARAVAVAGVAAGAVVRGHCVFACWLVLYVLVFDRAHWWTESSVTQAKRPLER